MNIKSTVAASGASLAVLACVGGVLAATGALGQGAGAAGGTPANKAGVPPAAPAQGLTSAATADVTCSENATPKLLSSTDSRLVDALASNFASQASPPRSAMSRQDAADTARQLSALPAESDLSAVPTAVVQLPFEIADEWMGGSALENSLVAPTRCVWLATVEAPYHPRSTPDGRVVTYKIYTAMFDARSGQYLGLSAGAEAPDVITGAGLTQR